MAKKKSAKEAKYSLDVNQAKNELQKISKSWSDLMDSIGRTGSEKTSIIQLLEELNSEFRDGEKLTKWYNDMNTILETLYKNLKIEYDYLTMLNDTVDSYIKYRSYDI